MKKSPLELLLDAYVKLSLEWHKNTPGENSARMWNSIEFLQRQIKKELCSDWRVE